MTGNSELCVSRLILAPRAAVWRAWAEPEQFEKWWIPEPAKCRVMTMDMWAGGGFETRMSENGSKYQPHLEGCFLDVVAKERIVFTTVLKRGWQPNEPWLALTSIITMMDEDGGTRYIARALHKTPADSQKHLEMGFHEGWGCVIDQLGRLAKTL